MGNSPSAPKITAQDRAILDLKNQRDKLKQYRRKVQGVLDREQEIARQALAKGDKRRALTALRQRKYQDGLLSKTDSQLETLQNLVSQIEFSLVEKDIVFGLKQGNEALAEIHKEMNLESVEKLMEETAEGIAYQKEIDELMQSRMTLEEEDEVQSELAALQAETQAKTKVSTPPARLPSVPTTELEVPEPESAPQQEEPEREERVALAA